MRDAVTRLKRALSSVRSAAVLVRDAVSRLSRALSSVRWIFMPLGLFSLVAVGVHAGAFVLGEWLLALFDMLNGVFVRACTAALLDLGRWLHLSTATVDGWISGAVGLIDLRERELAARWLAVGIELWSDAVLALPALSYHEHDRRERPGRFAKPPSGPLALARAITARPSLVRFLMPACTAAVALAGAARVATEMQASAFAALARALPPAVAGMVARSLAIALLVGLLASLGTRAVVQSAHVAYLRSERDAVRRRFWLRGSSALAVAVPLAALALVHGAPLLSFFR